MHLMLPTSPIHCITSPLLQRLQHTSILSRSSTVLRSLLSNFPRNAFPPSLLHSVTLTFGILSTSQSILSHQRSPSPTRSTTSHPSSLILPSEIHSTNQWTLSRLLTHPSFQSHFNCHSLLDLASTNPATLFHTSGCRTNRLSTPHTHLPYIWNLIQPTNQLSFLRSHPSHFVLEV